MNATTMAGSIMVMAEVDNAIKMGQAKMAMGNQQNPFQNQNDLQNTSIFAMKPPSK